METKEVKKSIKEFIDVDTKKKNIKSLNLVATPEIKKDRHKYKYQSGKQVYTFKSKRDLCKGTGLTSSKADEIMRGGNDGKIKISLI